MAPNADEFEFNWKRLEPALRDIHEKNAGGLSCEQLYRYAYKIVLKKAGGRLCENAKQFEERWFTDKVCPRIFELASRNLIAMTLSDVPGSLRKWRSSDDTTGKKSGVFVTRRVLAGLRFCTGGGKDTLEWAVWP